ncbi:PEP-utilizing enzyme [Vibrio hepatarius]|uniref:PEP-utilizing enzyme n=1 Tax=Vibrio hepatarius TaxID=171383 RepID=UPI001C088A6C|nr:PEP-utilizing enzyme [Vibrio hepatarius]MBU2895094.1 hypothetical protein [Vibrio hepatarius]
MSIELYFLGAGRPAYGKKPSALKNIAANFRVLDIQLDSFKEVVKPLNIYFLGGYHIEEIAGEYPELNYLAVPQWQHKNSLYTFFHAPFSGESAIVSYSDTLFRRHSIQRLIEYDTDVVFATDSQWQIRYSDRSAADIAIAEKINVGSQEHEFSGLCYFNAKALRLLRFLKSKGRLERLGQNLLDLVPLFKEYGLTFKIFDLNGEWAELNSPRDITHFLLGTKADTLARLESLVSKSQIGKQVSFSTLQWSDTPSGLIQQIAFTFQDKKVVIRSSSKSEDNWQSSNAGRFDSILGVNAQETESILNAINTVVSSYRSKANCFDQVLVQECIENIKLSGVLFTCSLESGAPYYRFNFDDVTGSTESVTSGEGAELRTVIVSKLKTSAISSVAPELSSVLEAAQELEAILSYDKLDIEFAIDHADQVHVFQVRPVVVNHDIYDVDANRICSSITADIKRFQELQAPSPFIEGNLAIFANMPDWNPAEIIGTRPKPLAFSLYQELITNDVWAQQRVEFGYRDVRPAPLIVSFSGHPYVDVRASLNSFIPANLNDSIAKKIVNEYLYILSNNPQWHDKIEFEVAFTVWTPNLSQKINSRFRIGTLTETELLHFVESLKELTTMALLRLDDDIKSVEKLALRRTSIIDSEMNHIDKVMALLSDCKKYGTLAFSHAARAGFVAMTFLNALVQEKVLTKRRLLQFQNSIDTVTGELKHHKYDRKTGKLTQDKLIELYGHLRPGTYEVTMPAYWEQPEQYMKFDDCKNNEKDHFLLTEAESIGMQDVISQLGMSFSVSEIMNYFQSAIKAREKVKFEFTKNLSKALDLCCDWADSYGLRREQLSYLHFSDLEKVKLNMISKDTILQLIEQRKSEHLLTKIVELPQVIQSESDFYCFEKFMSQPNYIGSESVFGEVVHSFSEHDVKLLQGKIILIPQADPGYDWLFSHSILGLITQYGGANSHMAIRAAELGLPAAIGVGDKLYEKLMGTKYVEIDCANHLIREIG